MLWGLTPCLDLIQEYELVNSNLPQEINFLIIGGADCRHILQTIAKKYRHNSIKINFFVIDACIENLAKQLLLLNIALQPPEALGLEHKTKVFMELYGNTLVRPSVAKYLTSTANDLVKMVTNFDYLNKMMRCVNMDIKYKERDYLENLLKFWCGKDDFNICDSWDRRLRKYLGVRYDSKVGVFDWDLHMRYHMVGGRQICNQEYRNFRMKGVAFSWLESEVSRPNRSLVCAIMPNGENYIHYGYLGDMITGPFVAFGLDCEDKSFLKCTNGQNSFRATDVTERNLKQIFYEIHHKTEYEHRKTTDIQLGPVTMKEEKLVVDIKAIDIITRATKECIELEDKINFLSISVLDVMKYKEKYTNLFDLVYFGNMYLKYFDKEWINNVSRENCLMLIENQIFVLEHRKKELEEFGAKINDTVEGMQVKKLKFDPQKDYYAKFVIKEK